MNSADKLKRFFKKAELGINSDTDEEIFHDVLEAHKQTIKQKPAQPANIGRIIMKSPISKIAVAVVVIIAFITGLTMFNETSGAALANVLTQIEKISAYKYQMDMTLSGEKALSGTSVEQKIHGTIFISHEFGMKVTLETSNPNSKDVMVQETYMLPNDNTLITIIPAQKKYTRIKTEDTYIEQTKNQYYDPYFMVEQILDCKYKDLGISNLDGIKVRGYQTTDPNYQGGMYSLSKVDIKLWIDVKTNLPVQMEMNLQKNEQTGYNISGIIHNFEWNIPVKASDFEPIIPQDYKIISAPQVPSFTEETAIKGLKLFRDLTGKFPEKLNPETLQPLVVKLKEAQDKLQNQSDNPQEEENYKNLKSMDISMTVQGLAAFYIFLNQDKKDPAYYGNIVTPQDFDQVLMRWKVSDTEYRVIFGRLNVMTVTNEVLAELEKTLPK